jgi:hypothetical protein
MELEESKASKQAGSLKDDHPENVDEKSVEGADTEFYIDPAKEAKLVRKLDLAFTPVIMLVYLCCFLDRSNIGWFLWPFV